MSVDPSAFAALRVVVLGDAMLDRYARGVARRLAAEAPAPVISEVAWHDRAGGAANAAAGAAALGARVALVSLAGEDAAGEALAEAIRAAGVDAGGLVRLAGRRTLVKTRLMAGGQLVARLDEGDAGPPGAEGEAMLAERLGALLEGADAVIVSDYAYGTVGAAAIDRLAEWRGSGGGRLVADARDLARLARLRPCAVTPNHAEAMALLGHVPASGSAPASGLAPAGGPAPSRLAQLRDGAPALLARTGSAAVVATLDGDGAAVLRAGHPPLHLPAARRVEGAGVTGAGDTFAAALALALAAGAGIGPAARLACLAAGVATAKPGTAVCTLAELRAALAQAAEVAGAAAAPLAAPPRAPAGPGAANALGAPSASPSGTAGAQARAATPPPAGPDAPATRAAHPSARAEPLEAQVHAMPSAAPVSAPAASTLAAPSTGEAGATGARPAIAATRAAAASAGPAAARPADGGPSGDGAPPPAILPSAAALAALGERLRASARRVVFTNGCFDILHDGHLGCLEEARRLGDALVVGVNSDASVRRLKGPTRPVNPCSARLRMLAALSFVDHVVAFEEDGPDALIRALRPDVFAKGGDYDRAGLPEAALVEALGGEVRLLSHRPGRSTTAIIARIQGRGPAGATAGARPAR